MSRFASTGIAFFVFTIMVGALYAVFVYVPTERQMGLVQRIFYFHVSSAICSLVAFALVFIGSIQYLRRREERWDRLAVASAELGVVFALIVLITGPLWARPVWGLFWRWEPRLTFMLITFMMYVAYLMVRAYAGGSVEQTRRFAAVLGIVAFVNVPLVHFSVNLWSADQQLHPQKVELAPKMVVGRYVSLIAIGSLFLFLLKRRMQLEQATQTLNRIRQKLDDDDDGR